MRVRLCCAHTARGLIGLSHAAVALLDVLEHGILVAIDALVAVALGQHLPQGVADGDDDGGLGLAFLERVVHRGQLVLDFLEQLNSDFLDFLDFGLGEVVLHQQVIHRQLLVVLETLAHVAPFLLAQLLGQVHQFLKDFLDGRAVLLLVIGLDDFLVALVEVDA